MSTYLLLRSIETRVEGWPRYFFTVCPDKIGDAIVAEMKRQGIDLKVVHRPAHSDRPSGVVGPEVVRRAFSVANPDERGEAEWADIHEVYDGVWRSFVQFLGDTADHGFSWATEAEHEMTHCNRCGNSFEEMVSETCAVDGPEGPDGPWGFVCFRCLTLAERAEISGENEEDDPLRLATPEDLFGRTNPPDPRYFLD
jgi:hypothetical protein